MRYSEVLDSGTRLWCGDSPGDRVAVCVSGFAASGSTLGNLARKLTELPDVDVVMSFSSKRPADVPVETEGLTGGLDSRAYEVLVRIGEVSEYLAKARRFGGGGMRAGPIIGHSLGGAAVLHAAHLSADPNVKLSGFAGIGSEHMMEALTGGQGLWLAAPAGIMDHTITPSKDCILPELTMVLVEGMGQILRDKGMDRRTKVDMGVYAAEYLLRIDKCIREGLDVSGPVPLKELAYLLSLGHRIEVVSFRDDKIFPTDKIKKALVYPNSQSMMDVAILRALEELRSLAGGRLDLASACIKVASAISAGMGAYNSKGDIFSREEVEALGSLEIHELSGGHTSIVGRDGAAEFAELIELIKLNEFIESVY